MTEPDRLGDEAARHLTKLFRNVAEWRKRIQGPQPAAEEGSSLRRDDQATAPYQLSSSVVGALVSAVDHLDALRVLVEDAGVLHPRSPLTLLRAAIENAATAVWLLSPKSRDERVLRALRLQWADLGDRDKALNLIGVTPTVSRAEYKERLEAVARRHGLDSDQVRRVTSDRTTYTSILKAAAEHIDDVPAEYVPFVWMASSGIAHARQWAVLAMSDIEKTAPAKDDILQIKTTTSDKSLIIAATAAALMVDKGWRLFDERRQAHLR